jgi:hypothetical protein
MNTSGLLRAARREMKKTLRAKVLGGSQKIFWETLQLFSSFLRGASCPKSPRVAATAASNFMLENGGDVKSEQEWAGHMGKYVTTVTRFAASKRKGEPWRAC